MAEVRGPFFSPNVDSIVNAAVRLIERRVADEGERHVVGLMGIYFKRPTPYYWTKTVAKPWRSHHAVHDSNIIYGPWLEGIGSRNKTTRFKGYSHFRKTTQFLNTPRNVAFIVDPVVTDLVRVLNG